MASKSAYSEAEKGAEIEDQLDDLDKRVDRLRVMYEQYFMGILKQAPSHLHSEAERKVRDLTQLQIRNTGLRYRFATITQKFGSYNTYWRRTLREIEAGRYVRDLNRVKRKALAEGEEIPQEILAAMPKRMREMVERDRAAAKASAARRGATATVPPATGSSADDTSEEPAAIVHSQAIPRQQAWTVDMDDDVDVDQMFDDITGADNKLPPPADAAPAVPMAAAKKPEAPPPIPRVTAPIRPGGRSASDTIPTPMEFPPFDEESPTRLRKPGETAVPLAAPAPAPAPAAAAPKPAVPRPALPPLAATPKPVAPVRPATVPATPPPVPVAPPAPAAPRMTQAMPGPRAPAPVAPRPAARVAPLDPPPGMSESDTRALYSKFLKARTLVGEKNDDMTYDKLLRTLRQQGSKIMEQYKAKGVEFGVVIKDNKVVLKAKPKV